METKCWLESTSLLHPGCTYFSLKGDVEGLGTLLLLLEIDIRRLNGDGHAELGLLLEGGQHGVHIHVEGF